MRSGFVKFVFAFAGLAAMAAAQQKPDLSGVWTAKNTPGARYRGWGFMAEEPPMTPWALEKFKLTKPSFGPRSFKDSNDPVNPTTVNATGCFPPGVPRIYLQPFPMEIIQQANRVLIIYEFDHLIRQVWMDGRAHLKDLPGTWMGDSIGKWEGDTLVVDTIGFNEKEWLLGREGMPTTEALHLIERFSRPDFNTLHYEPTIDDPGAYTKPWSGGWNIRWVTTDMEEYFCQDNERDSRNLVGQ